MPNDDRFDSQGWLPKGVSVEHNDTDRPEPVLTEDQWRKILEAR